MSFKSKARQLLCGVATTAIITGIAVSAQAGTFEDALRSAYLSNPEIKAQRRSMEQVNERVNQAISAFRPDISATYSKGRQKSSFAGSADASNDTETREINLVQPLFLGGSNYFTYESTKDEVKAARARLNSFEQNILLDAVVAYMDVVQNQAVLDLSENNAEVLEKQLQASKDRFKVGDVTRTDVAQSEARLSRAKSDVIQAKGDVEIALATFEQVMGYKPENILLMPERFPDLPQNLDQAVEVAMDANPNLEAADRDKDAAENVVDARVGTILPQISLIGTMSRQEGAGVFGNSDFDNDSVRVNVTIPLYRNGSDYSRVRAAKLNARKLGFDATSTARQVRQAVIEAWESLQTASATIDAVQENIRAAEIALDGVRQENQYGSRTVLDVLDAEQELFGARVNLVRAQRNRVVSFYNMLLVLGQLNPDILGLNVDTYNPKDHYKDVKWRWFGF
ncbi:MAG: TolC family outer membrane protein [Rickettsiales bacterium]|nr:TolC family outer membrane protein [Rickettsiales bacterium]